MSAGSLLRSPVDVSGDDKSTPPVRAEVRFQRSSASEYSDLSERFKQTTRDFRRQYFHLYGQRMEALRPLIALPKDVKGEVVALSDLDKHERGAEVIIAGTLFKNSKLKPDVLKTLAESNGLAAPPPRAKYVSEDDELILDLEDHLQRVRLRGEELGAGSLVTGVVCAVKGREKESGKFFVEEIYFPAVPPQPEWPIAEKDRFVAFLSGFDLTDDTSTACLSSLQLAVDWIVGEAGDPDDQEENAKIERVIIAGNSLSERTRDTESAQKAKYLTKDDAAKSLQAVKLLDDLLVQLSGSLEVDVMPGEFDPANQLLPQQPLHPCMFPQAGSYPTFRTVTNPYDASHDGFRLLGTSGQNTADILRNSSDINGPAAALERILAWSHLSPTSPDTLGCFPFKDQDPFVLRETPHVLFAGNHDKFESRLVTREGQKVVAIAVPRFSVTRSIVLLNLKTLEAEEVAFDGDFGRDD